VSDSSSLRLSVPVSSCAAGQNLARAELTSVIAFLLVNRECPNLSLLKTPTAVRMLRMRRARKTSLDHANVSPLSPSSDFEHQEQGYSPQHDSKG
jgi:hypothetical protein